MACERCGYELQISDYPFCKGSPNDHIGGHYGVTTDDIPGGVMIKHGLCNADGSPRRYDSKSEIAREAKKRGMTNYVTHIGAKGSDKSKMTTRWV